MAINDPSSMQFAGFQSGDPVEMSPPPRNRSLTPMREVPTTTRAPLEDECDIPCNSVIGVHKDLRRLSEEIDQDRANREEEHMLAKKSRDKWLSWAVATAVTVILTCAGTVYTTVTEAGANRERQKVLMNNVTMLLSITRGLEHDNTVTGQAVQESARDRAALHQAQRELETKIWELRQQASTPHR
jgi:hypothetical protein